MLAGRSRAARALRPRRLLPTAESIAQCARAYRQWGSILVARLMRKSFRERGLAVAVENETSAWTRNRYRRSKWIEELDIETG